MKFKHLLFAGAAVAVLAGGATSANAASLDIRVMLPNGTYLSLDNTPDRPWYNDQRIAPYQRYYYDSSRRAYIVYNGNARPGSHYMRHRSHPRQVVVVNHPAPRPVVVVHQPAPPAHNDNHGHIDHNDHEDHRGGPGRR